MHSTFCDDDELFTAQGQTVLGDAVHPNCNTHAIVKRARARVNSAEPKLHDAKVAALHFMIAAHPSPQIAHQLESDFDRHLDAISASMDHHFVAKTGSASPTETLAGVPGAVNPVPAKLVYVQSPTCHSTKLTLAWKLEVEMEDNWYEAYMDATHPSHIHSVVDWASDAAIHNVAPIPKEPATKATYRVWKWGINDPSEGKRSLESGYDVIASPIGWHSIPAGKDPLSVNVQDPTALVNYTSTWGNNVSRRRIIFSFNNVS